MSNSRRVVVYHRGYGCETGCCGHAFKIDDEEAGTFHLSHPWTGKDDFRTWAEELVRDEFGEDHVADLDWDECMVSDD